MSLGHLGVSVGVPIVGRMLGGQMKFGLLAVRLRAKPVWRTWWEVMCSSRQICCWVRSFGFGPLGACWSVEYRKGSLGCPSMFRLSLIFIPRANLRRNKKKAKQFRARTRLQESDKGYVVLEEECWPRRKTQSKTHVGQRQESDVLSNQPGQSRRDSRYADTMT